MMNYKLNSGCKGQNKQQRAESIEQREQLAAEKTGSKCQVSGGRNVTTEI